MALVLDVPDEIERILQEQAGLLRMPLTEYALLQLSRRSRTRPVRTSVTGEPRQATPTREQPPRARGELGSQVTRRSALGLFADVPTSSEEYAARKAHERHMEDRAAG